MLTALTAYFWIMAGWWTWNWLRNLFTPVTVEPFVKDATTESLAIATLGGGLAITLALLLSMPMTYLHAVAFFHMGLPVWLAWLGLTVSLLGGIISLTKNRNVKGAIGVLPLPTLALAWYGLQFLS